MFVFLFSLAGKNVSKMTLSVSSWM